MIHLEKSVFLPHFPEFWKRDSLLQSPEADAIIGKTKFRKGHSTLKYLNSFLIIMGFSLVGEALQRMIPIPIPASVYGIVLLFAALCAGIVKVEQVKTVGGFLSSILPILFVSPVVGILENWALIRGSVPAIFLLSAGTTVLTFFLSGRIAQTFCRKEGKRHE